MGASYLSVQARAEQISNLAADLQALIDFRQETADTEIDRIRSLENDFLQAVRDLKFATKSLQKLMERAWEIDTSDESPCG